jgi:hypothetical protein
MKGIKRVVGNTVEKATIRMEAREAGQSAAAIKRMAGCVRVE